MRYNHFDMLPERAFQPVGKRMTLEGGGGGLGGVVKSVGNAVGGVGGAVGNAVGSMGGVGKVVGPAIQIAAGQSPLSVFGGALGSEIARSMVGGGGGGGRGGVVAGTGAGKPLDISLDAYRKAYPNLTPYTTPAYKLREPTYDEWVRQQIPTYNLPSNQRLQYNNLFGPGTTNANNPLRPEYDVWRDMNRTTAPLTTAEQMQRLRDMMENRRNGIFFSGNAPQQPVAPRPIQTREEQIARKELEDRQERAEREAENRGRGLAGLASDMRGRR